MGNAKSTPKNRTGKSVVRQKLETAQKTNTRPRRDSSSSLSTEVTTNSRFIKEQTSRAGPPIAARRAEVTQLRGESARDEIPRSDIPTEQTPVTFSWQESAPQRSVHTAAIEIKQLKLPNNSLATIPMQICDATLKNLEKIDLSFNNIAAVPAVIGNLTSLSDLNLDSNAITSLPREMGQLKKLKSLSLKNNYISVKSTNFNDANPQPLPAELFTETSLMDLNLHGNKLGSTQLNEFEGFEAFLERRKQSKTKALYGGATTNMSLCGLE
ncbi:hypothetical protein THAOC_35305 [Thalassiosira oceanica]|uniref:Uncharacterized protein n=1 Tax=Thalassiosira oceanica TaxID=159749 RepID=K0R145_THAOC|nr:hypothetical protein THAOC_35305 [Thalassiosira oceanica]|eukprot:EJK46053.1 hypothetical protein THAOC_35305 [Thalassiosira oceanica]